MTMKMEHKFAMGHTFSAQDLFHNFPINKLKMDYDTVKKVYSDGDKRALSASIFTKGMQLIIEDIIENNICNAGKEKFYVGRTSCRMYGDDSE